MYWKFLIIASLCFAGFGVASTPLTVEEEEICRAAVRDTAEELSLSVDETEENADDPPSTLGKKYRAGTIWTADHVLSCIRRMQAAKLPLHLGSFAKEDEKKSRIYQEVTGRGSSNKSFKRRQERIWKLGEGS
ncbi:MAG: hypothetical protein R3B54_00035 [Bdellovibrionota bacterium]